MNASFRFTARVLLVVLLLSSMLGCVYLRNRGKDLLDVVWADIGVGPGIAVDFQVTEAFHSGLGAGILGKAGLRRRGFTTWYESGYAPILFRKIHLGFWPYNELYVFTRYGNLLNFIFMPKMYSYEPKPWELQYVTSLNLNPKAPWMNALDVDVNVHAILLGSRIGVSPGEFVDFLLGWFGLDIGMDDEHQGERDESLKPSRRIPRWL